MKPVLLLIPGMLNDGRVWADVANALASDAQVRLASVAQASSIPAMAEAAWQQIADVAPATPVILAGFSLGGYVAIEMLATPRRPLAAAALLSTSSLPEGPEGLTARERSLRALASDFAKTVDGIVSWGTDHAPPELAARLRQMMLEVGAETAIRQTRAIMARGDHRNALARLDLPVLVLCGTADRITPMARSEELAALVPRARLVRVDGAGHMLPCEQPAAVAQALRDLLRGLPSHSQSAEEIPR
jgi:pimeloyl-ACP methyl ester carboxylesterase